MFPVMLNLRGRLGVVIGGGPVGRRKANALLDAGSTVRLVCLAPPALPLRACLEWRTEPYRPDHLDGAALVFAAACSSGSAAGNGWSDCGATGRAQRGQRCWRRSGRRSLLRVIRYNPGTPGDPQTAMLLERVTVFCFFASYATAFLLELAHLL